MTHRVHNFGAGPAALPQVVLQRVREELLDYHGTGMSILESSHRGPAYESVHRETIARLRSLLGAGDDYEVLFMGGGARTQFSLVPMNVLREGTAGYLTTGRWSELALAAAEKAAGKSRISELWSSSDNGHDRVPGSADLEIPRELEYLHYTSNNTIYGTQYAQPPVAGDVPLVADMSSDILSKPLDLAPFGLVYAGAQKNLGPAGLTVVVVHRELLERSPAGLPDTLSYARMAAKNSLLNTPPVFAIYVLGLVLELLEKSGGVTSAEERNRAKAERLYHAIDSSEGFYRGHAERGSRSRMNVTFRLATPELEREFLIDAERWGLVGLKGHRSVGGIRASLYNAVEIDSVEVLVQLMDDFRVSRA